MKRVDRMPYSAYLLAAVGALSLVPASPDGAIFLYVNAGVLLGWGVAERRTGARIPRSVARAADLLTVTLVVGLAALRFALSEWSLVSIGYVLAAAQLGRVFRKKRARDMMVVLGIGTAQIALAAFLTRDGLYLPLLVATVVLGVLATSGLPTDTSSGGDVRIFLGRPAGRAGFRSRCGAIAQPALLVLAILLTSSAVFLVLPRGAPFRESPEENEAASERFSPDEPLRSVRSERNAFVGFTDQVRLGEIGKVKEFPVEAFTVRFSDGGRPARVEDRLLYFRGAVLGDFDGRNWHRDKAVRPGRWLTTKSGHGMLAIQPELNRRRPGTLRLEQDYRLRRSPFNALPVLHSVIGIGLSPALPRVLDLGCDCYSADSSHPDGFEYRVTSLVPRDPMRPVVQDPLGPSERERLTRLYPDSDRVRMLAREVAGSGDSLEKIARLEKWLAANCSYTLRFSQWPPARPLEYFLFESRAGHCEYFASALAMMLRAVGVPTRLVTGFRGGLWIASMESYYVRMSDAHAWVEAWVEGRGWVRLDPTPPDSRAVSVPDSRVPSGGPEPKDWLDEHVLSLVRSYGPGDQKEVFRAIRSGTGFVLREGLGLNRPSRPYPPPLPVLFVLAGGAVLLARWRRRRRGSGPRVASGAPVRRTPPPPPAPFYEEAVLILERAGESRRPPESPREFLCRVQLAHGERVASFAAITGAFESLRYGLAPLGTGEEERLRSLTAHLRRCLEAPAGGEPAG